MESAIPAGAQASSSLLDRYAPLIGARANTRLLRKAQRLRGLRILHINSTRDGGGVAQILSSLTPLMNDVGLEADWFVVEGTSKFFLFTKAIHNGLQGELVSPSPAHHAIHRQRWRTSQPLACMNSTSSSCTILSHFR